jgi:TetR/AcrR family transcriptional repressor of nem operon
MAGRPKIFDETEVLDKAVEVFWEKGYEAASADELLKAMGIGKGSFYLAFKGGKQELYEKSLERFAGNHFKQFSEELAASNDPLELIRHFFRRMAYEPLAKQDRGCYIGNALIQLTTEEAATRQVAAKLLKRMERIFTEAIRKAQAGKTMKNKQAPELLGRYLVNLWNGLNVTRRTHPGQKQLQELIELNLQVLY